jgi:hypothetical protein
MNNNNNNNNNSSNNNNSNDDNNNNISEEEEEEEEEEVRNDKNDNKLIITTKVEERGGRKSIDYIIDSRDVQTNKYLKLFVESDLCKEFKENEEFRSWAWSKKTSQLKKEIIESYAICKHVREEVKKVLTNNKNEHRTKKKKCVFFDLCSGKGFMSIILAREYPDETIFMLDSNKNMNLSHLKACENVKFQNIDLYSEKCEELIVGALRANDFCGVMIGMHLCGNLSRRAIELWTNLMSSKYTPLPSSSFNLSLVLTPCCLPHKVRVPKRIYADFGYTIKERQKDSGINEYDLWTTALYNVISSRVGSSFRKVSKRMFRDEHILSPKNLFIIVACENENESICKQCDL